MSKAALGPRAEEFSRDEFTEFSHEFERFLLGRWVGRIARNADSDFEIQGASWDERRKVVDVKTRGGKQVRPSMVGARIEKPAHEWTTGSAAVAASGGSSTS